MAVNDKGSGDHPRPVGSLFGPVSDTDRRRWQIQAHAALASVLFRAHEAGLPPVTWTVTDRGALSARIGSSGTPGEVRALFTAWVSFLDLHVVAPHSGGGWQTCAAYGELAGRGGSRGRPVGLRADIPTPDPTPIDPTTKEC
ncbi:hypothetical protein ATK36_0472 [Amycolatopsis sulphurea]|uniref:Uncharacterized protein n=1 Tax=Amycolatopsis sulphurea TaxID=76022 RepID=A0A2A9G1W2_9PSEU|nr:hypothetical protein [Amycolatopsis sulphurea]PFG56936.1 hypothetical protein ATK36_0472 [Amycolatopsis sulphurea]